MAIDLGSTFKDLIDEINSKGSGGGGQGEKGEQGEQGYGFVASVSRTSFTEANWTTYGTTGHTETWSGTSVTSLGCRVGDLFLVIGTATDSGNAHMAIYKNTATSGNLKGNCIAHFIALRGATGAKGSDGANGKDGTNGTNGKDGVTPTIQAQAGSHINEVGTPTVTATTSGTTTTFTFDYLKGETGEGGGGSGGGMPVYIKASTGLKNDGNYNVNVTVLSGTLQVGDRIQLCKPHSSKHNFTDDNGVQKSRNRKRIKCVKYYEVSDVDITLGRKTFSIDVDNMMNNGDEWSSLTKSFTDSMYLRRPLSVRVVRCATWNDENENREQLSNVVNLGTSAEKIMPL